jgi:hypothetical protein
VRTVGILDDEKSWQVYYSFIYKEALETNKPSTNCNEKLLIQKELQTRLSYVRPSLNLKGRKGHSDYH